MSWIWSALMPHPPILIPEVGRGRENEAINTLNGIKALTKDLKKPDLLLILSPHQPYVPGALFINTANSYHGSFAMFGVPSVKIEAKSSAEDIKALCDYLERANITIYAQPFENLIEDQGSMVPLYFLQQAWGDFPEIIISSPIGLTPEKSFEMGQALADFQSEKNKDKTWALLASGDLSHRLTKNAPAGYEPEYAPKFEAAIEEALKINSPKPIYELDKITLERAGECGLRSVMAMLGLAKTKKRNVEHIKNIKIFSHEWPFGVGYCNALWRI